MDKLQEIKEKIEMNKKHNAKGYTSRVLREYQVDYLIQTIEQQQELIKGKSELIEQYSESKKELLAENERLKEENTKLEKENRMHRIW